MNLTVILVILALLTGYVLGKTAAPSLHGIEEQLVGVKAALEQLTTALCGDKRLEKVIDLVSADGAELSEEELSYDGGSLKRLERAIREFSDRITSLAAESPKKVV